MNRDQYTRNHSKSYVTTQMYTHSKIDTSQQSVLSRKNSTHKCNTIANIDQLVQDVKIAHIKQNKYSQHIAIIMKQLQSLKSIPHVNDEIITIQLLLDTINKKIMSSCMSYSRERKLQSSVKKSVVRETSRKEMASPTGEIDDASSIVYTKFSLKDVSNISHQSSVANFDGSLQTPRKSISTDDESTNREVDKLNNQISLLNKLLNSKGSQGAFQPKVQKNSNQIQRPINTSNMKLSLFYQNSQNINGPTVIKNRLQKSKQSIYKQSLGQCNKLRMIESKFR